MISIALINLSVLLFFLITITPETVLPTMIMTKDYDDANNTTFQNLAQYYHFNIWQLGTATSPLVKTFVKPLISMGAYQGVTTGYTTASKAMLVDTSSPDIQHYGLKMAINPIRSLATTTVIGYLMFEFKFHMTMKNNK